MTPIGRRDLLRGFASAGVLAATAAAPARAANFLLLRNTGLANFFDRCSVSIPCHTAGEAPVGLMLVGETGGDARLLAIAAAVEKCVAPPLM